MAETSAPTVPWATDDRPESSLLNPPVFWPLAPSNTVLTTPNIKPAIAPCRQPQDDLRHISPNHDGLLASWQNCKRQLRPTESGSIFERCPPSSWPIIPRKPL